jgi:transposase
LLPLPSRKITPNKMTLSAEERGAIRFYFRSPRATITRATKIFAASPNTIRAILSGTQRVDMAARAKANVRSTKKKAMAERRQVVRKSANVIVTRDGRKQPRYPSASTIATVVAEKTGKHVSVSTITRDLHAQNFRNLVRPKRSFDSVKHFQARKRFAGRVCWRDKSVLESIIFSDEHYVDTNDHGSRTQWVQGRDQLVPRVQQSRFNVPSVQIWAAVGIGWRSAIVFVDWGKDDEGKVQRMTGDRYKRHCLQPNVPTFLRRKALFMQDGARCHTCKDVKTYLAKKGVNVLEGWPAHSPDLNMIESLWAELDRRVSLILPVARDKDELKRHVQQAWDAIPQAVIDSHVRHFATMLRKVRGSTL